MILVPCPDCGKTGAHFCRPLSPELKEAMRQEARDMAEIPTLTDLVVGWLKQQGWKVFRVRQGRAGWNLGSGFPDIHAVRERVFYAELKRQNNELDPKQVEWREALETAGQEYHLWRPLDWLEGRIQELTR